MRFSRTLITLCILSFFILFTGCSKRESAVNPDFDVIIIGGGMGGLSAGAHLATKDMKVLLVEKNKQVGGCASSFTKGDFTFEAALHEMSGGGPGKNDRGLFRLLKACGVDQKVELYEVPHFYRSIFPGDVDVTLPGNWEGFKAELKKRWPEESEGIDTFHTLCSNLHSELLELKYLFRFNPVKAGLTKMMVPLKQPTFFEWKDKTTEEFLDYCFKNEELKAVVAQLWVYYGAPVEEQTALIFMAASDVYLNDGVWHIKGTSQALSNAYAERIQELGGTVLKNTLATKVLMKGKRAVGIKTASGTTYTARYVIANTDPYQLTRTLVGKEHFTKKYLDKINQMKPANSLYGVYLGLNIDLKALGYDDSEIFYNTSTSAAKMNDNMMNGNNKEGMVAITVYSNYGDPIYAPEGKSNVVLVAYSDHAIWPSDRSEYEAFKDEKVDDLIQMAAKVIPELADSTNIEVKEGFTPGTIQSYTRNKGGVVYGFYLNKEQWQKIPSKTPIDNVFVASSWTQTWHGVGASQVNGWRVARLILDREGVE